MGIFGFLRTKENIHPSKKHRAFSNIAIETIGSLVEKHGFHLHAEKNERFFTTIIWKKEKQYLKISATDYPMEPSQYDIILGEGNCDDFFESEWDSISICDIKRFLASDTNPIEYDFPKKRELQTSLENAKIELLKFGNDFLHGNMDVFYRVRFLTNGATKPEKIIVKDATGNVDFEMLPYTAVKKPKK